MTSNATQNTYGVNELIVTYGANRLTGWADGEFMTVSYDDDIYKYTNGADGEVARVKSNKLMATITLRFLQTSASNDILSAYLIADIDANAPQNFLIKDLNGETIMSSAKASIIKFPDFSFGTENSNREWQIKAPKLVGFLGGNFINS